MQVNQKEGMEEILRMKPGEEFYIDIVKPRPPRTGKKLDHCDTVLEGDRLWTVRVVKKGDASVQTVEVTDGQEVTLEEIAEFLGLDPDTITVEVYTFTPVTQGGTGVPVPFNTGLLKGEKVVVKRNDLQFVVSMKGYELK